MGGLAMGTPNRLKILFKPEVNASKIQPNEWLEVIDVALKECRPQLKYLPQFQPIDKSILNSGYEAYTRRIFDTPHEGRIVFPKDFNKETRCVEIADISHKAEGENPAGPEYGMYRVAEEKLLLTQKGEFVLWELKYRREIEYGLGFRGHHTGVKEVVELCTFVWVGKKELQNLLFYSRKDKTLGLSILQKLCVLVGDAVDEKAKRLIPMRELQTFLCGIRNRINLWA